MAGVPITFQPVPDLPGRVVRPGDISVSDGAAVNFTINRGGDIRERNAAYRQIQYNVPGLTGNEVAELFSVAEQNLLDDLNGVAPTYQSITFSGLVYENCYLIRATPSGSLTVGPMQVVEQTTLVYETKDRYLA